MIDARASAWKQPAPLPDEVRCDALLWFARYPERYRGDVRCRQVATYRVAGTETIVCELHAAPLRFGQTIDTVHGPVSGGDLERLEQGTTPHRLKSARVEETERAPRFLIPLPDMDDSPGATYANATRDAFPEGLPARPPGLDERRWRVLQLRWEGATLAEIADELGVSRERAHQLERSAIGALLPSSVENRAGAVADR
jgi:hypothetical protein